MADLISEWFMEPSVRANYRTMVYYPGTGQDTFDINFEGGYINKSDVKAFMVKDDTRDRVNLNITFIGGSTSRVKVSQVVPKGWTVCIFRDTPKAKPLAQFTDGAIINERNLDRNAQQAMFAVSEMVDRFDSTVDSVDAALKEVYEANKKSEQAIKTANEAKVIAQGAVQTANSAVSKADQAISTANTASSKADGAIKTANDAKSIAQGLDAQIKAANETSKKAVDTANAASVTANNALKVANGIDAKATQALTNSTQALNTANGVDGKATQAQKDAKEALDKANTAINTGNVAKGLTDRVENFPTNVNVAWKGAHKFIDSVQVRESGIHPDALPYAALQFNSADKSVRLFNAANSTSYYSLVIHSNGKLTYSGEDILVNRYTSPNFTNTLNVNSPTNSASISLKNTGNNTSFTIKNAGTTLYVSRMDNGTETGWASFPPPAKGDVMAYQSYVARVVGPANSDTETNIYTINKSYRAILSTSGYFGLWSYSTSKFLFRAQNGVIDSYSSGDTARLRLYNNSGRHLALVSVPHSDSQNIGTIVYRESNEDTISALRIPRKNGDLAVAQEHYTKEETDSLLSGVGKSTVMGYVSVGNNDGSTGGNNFKYIARNLKVKAVNYPTIVRIDLQYAMFRQRDIPNNTSISVAGATELYTADTINSGQQRSGSSVFWAEVPANTTREIVVTLGVRAADGSRSAVSGKLLVSRSELNTSSNIEV